MQRWRAPPSAAGGPAPVPVAVSPWMEVVQQLPPPLYFLPQWETFWHSLVGDAIFLPLHIPTGTEIKTPLEFAFLDWEMHGASCLVIHQLSHSYGLVLGNASFTPAGDPQLGEQGHSEPREPGQQRVLGSSLHAALATCTDARSRERCLLSTCLLTGRTWGEMVRFAGGSRDPCPPGQQAFWLEVFAVEGENSNCGILLSIRANLAFPPIGHFPECPPGTPMPGHGARPASSSATKHTGLHFRIPSQATLSSHISNCETINTTQFRWTGIRCGSFGGESPLESQA